MTKTNNIGLNRPDFDISPWHDELNENATIIDGVLFSLFGLTNIKGGWKPAITVIEGERYTDLTSGITYEALSSFTTLSLPNTFADERIVFPARWQVLNAAEAVNAAASSAASAVLAEGYKDAAIVAQGLSEDAVITATTQAGIATTQAGNSATSAGNAATNALTTITQAGIATTQAGIATTKAAEAAASAVVASDAADVLTAANGVFSHVLLREIEITKGVDTPVATINEAIPAAFKTIQIILDEFEGSVSNSSFSMRVGVNGDVGPFEVSTNHVNQLVIARSNTPFGLLDNATSFILTPTISNASPAFRGFATVNVMGLNRAANYVKLLGISGGVNITPENVFIGRSGRLSVAGNYNAVQFFSDTGNIVNLRLKIYGVL